MSNSIDIALPFYGDVLDEMTAAYDLPLTSEITTKGDEVQDRFLAFQSEVTDQMRLKAGITDAQVDAIYGDNPRPKGPENWEWLQAAFIALDRVGRRRWQRIGDREAPSRRLHLYHQPDGKGRHQRTVDQTEWGDQPTVIVAHSLGTVVAYDILREFTAPEVPLFVTLGSPLGITAIRRGYSRFCIRSQ